MRQRAGRNFDVFAVAHFDSHLAGCHLAAIGRADDCLSFVALVCHKHSRKQSSV